MCNCKCLVTKHISQSKIVKILNPIDGNKASSTPRNEQDNVTMKCRGPVFEKYLLSNLWK